MLARRGALLAPGLDELAVARKLHDARIGVAAMAVADEDVAVGRDEDRRRRVELVVAGAGDAGLAERQQELAVRAELEHLLALAAHADAVGQPDIAFAIDMQAVRKDGEAGAEALHQLARRVELQDRVELGAGAVERLPFLPFGERDEALRAAALGDPDARAVGIDVDRAGRAPDPAFRQFRPVLDRAVGIGQRVGRRHGLACAPRCPTTAMTTATTAMASTNAWRACCGIEILPWQHAGLTAVTFRRLTSPPDCALPTRRKTAHMATLVRR